MTILKYNSQKFEENQIGDDVVIARYMDYPEFISLLNNKLKFTSLNKLREHDVFEFNFDPSLIRVDRDQVQTDLNSVEELDSNLQMYDWEKHWFSSCWCEDIHENMALWKIFGAMGKGIRIESTVGLVNEAINKAYWPLPFYVHKIEYKNNNKTQDIFEAIYTKRNEFKYESEIRFTTQISFHHNKDYLSFVINPRIMIKKIVIGPQILWTESDVIKLVNLFGLNPNIVFTSCYDIRKNTNA